MHRKLPTDCLSRLTVWYEPPGALLPKLSWRKTSVSTKTMCEMALICEPNGKRNFRELHVSGTN